jgi:hypothetical protein
VRYDRFSFCQESKTDVSHSVFHQIYFLFRLAFLALTLLFKANEHQQMIIIEKH